MDLVELDLELPQSLQPPAAASSRRRKGEGERERERLAEMTDVAELN